jgi:hypothetical protein
LHASAQAHPWAAGALAEDSASEQLHRSGADLVQHRLQRFVGWLGNFDELRRPLNDGCAAHG